MTFTLLDWSAIIAYLLITLLLGLYFRRSAGRSSEDYFVSGRTVSWWLAGTSMVATTFAADTPLLVAGLVYTQGVSVRASLASFWPDDRRAIRRNALFGQARRVSARLSRHLSGRLNELPDPRLGDESDDQHRGHYARRYHQPVALPAKHVGKPDRNFWPCIFRHGRPRADYLHFFPDSLHRIIRFPRRAFRGPVDRPISVHLEDEHRYCHCLVRRERRRRNELDDQPDRSAARQEWRRRSPRVST